MRVFLLSSHIPFFSVSPSGGNKLAVVFGKCSLHELPSSHKIHGRTQRIEKGSETNKIINSKMNFPPGAFFNKIPGWKSI